MKSQDIRQSFLDYFSQRDHQVVSSAPLVPHGDATLLFVNAGMVPFKTWFQGAEEPPFPRAVSAQKCLRVSGKHNDLENVGPSPRHHTFFEMLGNFSFGDYFKEEAIRFGWELVTEVWGLPKDRLFATVFEEDDEAEELWRKCSSLPAERILRCGAADNFWAMGPTGPCGPCSEIFVDLSPEEPPVSWDVGNESGRYLEIWNLVFMQFDRAEDGEMRPLPNPSIDTGSGLERVSAVMQGVRSNYESDLFQPLLSAAAELASTSYGANRDADVSLRVIADHLRAVSFLLADGVIPGPEGRGYVLRRLLRRAQRHGMRLGFEEPFLHRLVPVLDEAMGGAYPELASTCEATRSTVQAEEEKYLATRASGARRVQEAIDRTRAAGSPSLSGDELFRLYDTYGQEIDTIREIAEEEQLGLDDEGFEALLEERRSRSRAMTGELQKRIASLRQALGQDGELAATEFVGYELPDEESGQVLRLAKIDPEGASAVTELRRGDTGVAVLDRTPFYAESGGQVGDRGSLEWEGGQATVTDTRKDGSGTIYHFLEVSRGALPADAAVRARVDRQRRLATERNHTATHLLHAALHRVVGDGARQAGSLVAPDRLRFDFTHPRPLSAEELREIENLANGWVLEARGTAIREDDFDQAVARGAMALFGEKYGDRVRTVEIPGVSLELCGGCHVRNSGEIGPFLLTGERGVASGVRRIEAVTGETAVQRIREQQSLLDEVARELSVAPERAPAEAGGLKQKVKDLEKELADLRRQLLAGGGVGEEEEIEIEGIKLMARLVPETPKGELRALADQLRDRMGSGAVVLATSDDEKVSLVATVSKDLTGRLAAGKLVGELAKIVGGRGGGRPDFAQAGGREPDKLPELMRRIPEIASRLLGDG